MPHWLKLLPFLLLCAPALAQAAPAEDAPSVARLACAEAIRADDRAGSHPAQLVQTIALVESGRLDAQDRQVRPWPWTINAAGIGHFYETKADAIAAVAAFRAAGIQSIDVGCMQINLLQHPQAFASLEDAFDPATNVAYGIRFLDALYRRNGDWPLAVASYHSATPEIGAPYWEKVQRNWALGSRYGAPRMAAAPAQPVLVDVNMTAAFAERSREMAEDHRRNMAMFGPVGGQAGARSGAANVLSKKQVTVAPRRQTLAALER